MEVREEAFKWEERFWGTEENRRKRYDGLGDKKASFYIVLPASERDI